MNEPRKSCPMGHTRDDLEHIFGERLPSFQAWMNGQTGSVCDGRFYNYETRGYEPSPCVDHPHGLVIYSSDVKRYIAGLPIMDW